MVGIYFSGTGNTKYCAEYLLRQLDSNGTAYSIEYEKSIDAIKSNNEIVFAYPIYYSYLPKIVNDFIVNNKAIWANKKIFIVVTMGLFSGDGTGCAARLFKKYGAKVLGGLHIKMPDCIGDVKLLKKTLEENRKIVAKAEIKLNNAINKIKSGNYPKDGLSFACRLAGLFGQRLYFRKKTKNFYNGIQVDNKKCISCGLCESVCPMKNIILKDGRISFDEKCTLCYRCFSDCPKQAITILGKQVFQQCKFENFKY